MTRLRVSARSDRGLVRVRNEDAAVVNGRVIRDGRATEEIDLAEASRVQVFAVLDGIGSHAGGDEASLAMGRRLAEAASLWAADVGTAALAEGLRRAVDDGHRELLQLGESDPAGAGRGTTLTALVVSRSAGVVVHVGDSRLLRWRDGIIRLMTRPHVVQVQDPLGRDERNLLDNSIGAGATCHVDVIDVTERLLAGDRWLLATDGAVDESTNDTLLSLALAASDVESIIDAALSRGGHDNATAVLVEVCP